jgi:hypothetical protein
MFLIGSDCGAPVIPDALRRRGAGSEYRGARY